MNNFIKELKQYRHILSKQTISTLRGQAISGNVEGAIKGLQTALNKKQSNKDKMTNAHRGTRYIIKNYGDVDYKTQLSINLNNCKDGADWWLRKNAKKYDEIVKTANLFIKNIGGFEKFAEWGLF